MTSLRSGIRVLLAKTDSWVEVGRVKAYPFFFLFLFYGLWLFWIFSGTGMLDRRGTIIGCDFLTVYAGSIFAHSSDPGGAYSLEGFHAVQNEVAGAAVKPLMWRYPPPAFIVVWPLSLLPYLPSCFLWLTLTAGAFYWVIRSLVPGKPALLLFLSYAGFYQNWIQGQNSLFTGALLCGGLLRSGTHPCQGGFLLGLLAYKPQYAALAMLFLLVRREWKALLSACGSGLALVLASFAAYGAKPWHDFFESLPVTMMAVEKGFDPIHKLITFFGALVLAGVPAGTARILHWIFLFGIIAACCAFWLKSRNRRASAAATVCGTLLVTPYAYDYESVILAFPLAWLIGEGLAAGWRVGEKSFCAFAWMAPFLIPPLAFLIHVQLGWLVSLGLFLLIWQRPQNRDSPGRVE